ncbi:ABC transporter permease, partial [Enterobacteriaceae bacterium TzEc077]
QLIPQLVLSFSVVGFLLGPLPIAIFTSVIVLLGFILPSIWELLNTPPIRVIREQAKSRKSLFFMFFAGITSLVIFSLVLSENLMLSIWVLTAIILLCILLYTVVWLLLRALKKMKTRLSFYIRSASQSALQITALALGLSLITVLS